MSEDELELDTLGEKKIDITKHKNYKLLKDYDKRNFFDIQRCLATREKAKLRKNTVITRMNIQID